MLFQKQELPLPGVYLLTPRKFEDDRGTFVKTFHAPEWKILGLAFTEREACYSTSQKNVLRGMHFQVPPAAHQKVVTCLHGAVLDVMLDLRKSSPTFGQAIGQELSAENPQLLFLPIGIAHGFLARTDDSGMLYKTDHEYAPDHDAGLHWNSFNFNWGIDPENVLCSSRDQEHPRLEDVKSPF